MPTHYQRSNHHVFLVLLAFFIGGFAVALRWGSDIARLQESRQVSSLSFLQGEAALSSALPSPTLKPVSGVALLFGASTLASLQGATNETEKEFFAAATPCVAEKLGADFATLQAGTALPTDEMKRKAAACLNSPAVQPVLQKMAQEREEASVLQALKPWLPVFNILAR